MEKLDDATIIQCMKTIFDLEVKKSELNNPTNRFVSAVYTSFLKDFGVHVEELDQIPMNAPLLMQTRGELFRDSLFYINLSRSVAFFIKKITGQQNFYLKDIIRPDPNRTRRFFSTFLYFYDFTNDNLQAFREVEEKVDAERSKLDAINGKIEAVTQEYNKRLEENQQCEKALEREEEIYNIHSKNLQERKEFKNRLRGRLEGGKNEIASLNMKKTDMETQILKLKQELQYLKNETCTEEELEEIRKSDENIEELQANVRELRDVIKSVEQERQNSESALRLVDEEFYPFLTEIEAEDNKKLENNEHIKDLEKKLSNSLQIQDKESLEHQNLKKDLALLEERKWQLNQQASRLCKSEKKELEQQKEILESLRKDKQAQAHQISGMEAACTKLAEKVKDRKNERERMESLINLKLSSMKSKIEDYHKRKMMGLTRFNQS